MRNAQLRFEFVLMFLLAFGMIVRAQDACEKLTSAVISGAKITFAQTVAAGTFAGPPAAFTGRDLTALYKSVPAFCRVVAEAKPTTDSDIRIEVWLPASGWNGQLQGIGNGGFAGQIDYMQLGAAVTKGYAATATNTGHEGTPKKSSTLATAASMR